MPCVRETEVLKVDPEVGDVDVRVSCVDGVLDDGPKQNV